LQFVDVDHPPRSIVFTSSVPNEGKSTTVCNLAITIAQAGLKVLVVEADLRRPRASTYFGLSDDVGLTSVLIGTAKIADATQQWHADLPLYVLPAGPTPPNPSELLASMGMADLLKQLEASYDLVLLDSPPLLPVTDAAVMASRADGAVIIVRYGKTRREQLQRSVESLAGVSARTLGCVINMAPTRGRDAYHYGYAYDYAPRDASRSTGASSRSVASEKRESPTSAPKLTPSANGSTKAPAPSANGVRKPAKSSAARKSVSNGSPVAGSGPSKRASASSRSGVSKLRG
jgi:non-specific protein-tyrosine kinase